MNKLMLDSSMVTDVTMISNFFIDEYMPRANGDFVKIYIHLLRLINSRQTDFDLNTVADTFNFTEGDVMRALKYWEGLGLLSISKSENNIINGIRLEPFRKDKHYFKGVHSMQMNPSEVTSSETKSSRNTFSEEEKANIPQKKQYSSNEIDAFAKDQNVGQLMFLAQAYLARPLNSTDINCLLYMYDSLSLTPDFIEYIMETCISEGHKSLSYIEKTATSYYERGILDSKAAKKYSKQSLGLGKKVLDAFGITGRLPGKDENNFILHWQDEFGYGEDMIIEACNRTLSHTHTPSFKYANSILASWYKSGVRGISDIAKLDEEHREETKEKYATKKAAGVNSPKLKGGQKIADRSYDFNSLEKQLTRK